MGTVRCVFAGMFLCLLVASEVHAQDGASEKATACKAEGWVAALPESDRIAFKKLGWCPEDQEEAEADKSSFATPIDLEVGPNVTLKGAQIFPENARHFFATIDIDSLWTPGSDGTYRSSASIRPTYSSFLKTNPTLPECANPEEVIAPPIIGHAWQLYGDARQRVGEFPQEDDETKTTRVDQLLLGVGADFRIFSRWLRDLERRTRTDNEYPRIAATYYDVRDRSETEQELPPVINVDSVQVAFTAEIPLAISEGDPDGRQEKAYDEYYQKLLKNVFCKGADPGEEPVPTSYFPWSLSIDLRASRPTTGDDRDVQKYADIAIKYKRPEARMGYVARYRTGEDLGFEYDDELLLGILVRLLR
jgi:hypothetical protein